METNDLGEMTAVELLELVQRIAEEIKLRMMQMAWEDE